MARSIRLSPLLRVHRISGIKGNLTIERQINTKTKNINRMRETMLIFHFIGLTMGLGTGFAHAFLGIAIAKMPKDEALKFRLHSLVLGKMGHVGLAFLIISGLYLITPYWKILPSTPLLIVKLSLVIVLIVLITLMSIAGKKAQKGDAEVQFKKMGVLGKLTLITALAIVIVAVNIFH
jgi:uncharacterized membrane protein